MFVEPIFLPVRVGEGDRAPDRVAQIDLALDHVRPGWRVRVLEIGHEHFRAGIERVDHHLAIGRPGDLDPAIAQVGRDRRASPVAFADLFRFRQKIERATAIERRLALLTARQTFPAAIVDRMRCSFATKASASGVRISANAWCDRRRVDGNAVIGNECEPYLDAALVANTANCSGCNDWVESLGKEVRCCALELRREFCS